MSEDVALLTSARILSFGHRRCLVFGRFSFGVHTGEYGIIFSVIVILLSPLLSHRV